MVYGIIYHQRLVFMWCDLLLAQLRWDTSECCGRWGGRLLHTNQHSEVSSFIVPSPANSTKKLVFWRPKSASKSPRVRASLSISLAPWVFAIKGLGPNSRTAARWTWQFQQSVLPMATNLDKSVSSHPLEDSVDTLIAVWTAMNWMVLDETPKDLQRLPGPTRYHLQAAIVMLQRQQSATGKALFVWWFLTCDR